MAFTERVIDRTKRIEKQLKEAGASGVGLHELVTSVSRILDDQLRLNLRYIITIRNKVVHEHDYVFDDDEEKFISKCDKVLEKLSNLRPAQKLSNLRPAQKPPAETYTSQSTPPPSSTENSRAIGKHTRYPRFSIRQALSALVVLILLAAIGIGIQQRDRVERQVGAAWQTVANSYKKFIGKRQDRSESMKSFTRYDSVAEAQKAAIEKYPALRIAGSDFNKRFLALHKKYRNERPELFHNSNWPVVIADEVAASSK